MATSEQRYLRNTAILETVLSDHDGNRLRITDFAPRFKANGRIFRPQTIVRLVEPVEGAPRIQVDLRPRHGYAAQEAETTRGTNHIRFLLGGQVLRMTTDAPVEFVERRTPFLLDRPCAFILGPDERLTQAPCIPPALSLKRRKITGANGCAISRCRSTFRTW